MTRDRRSERIAITGVGAVTALGHDAESTFRRLAAGDVAFAPITLFDTEGQRCRVGAEVRGLSVADVAPADDIDAWSRSDALAVLAAEQALEAAGVTRAARVALAVGATTGGMFEAEDVLVSLSDQASVESVRRLLAYPLSTSADRIAARFGNVERRVTICSACSSGAIALVQAAGWIRSGAADIVLAGGTDGLCRLTLTGFNALGATSANVCRPFDSARDGLTLGEGAAFLAVEAESDARRRGAQILGFLSGWAIAAEAHHITHPEPTGETAARLIQSALERAGLSAGDLAYVNAHGTGTKANDAMEAKALASALGEHAKRVAVSSSKGQLGHTLGAAGAIEAAVTALALAEGVAPPTGGLRDPDPELSLCHVTETGRRIDQGAAISNSFGFGGTGAVLVFERADAPLRTTGSSGRKRIVVSGAVTLGARGIVRDESNAQHLGADGPVDPMPDDPLELLDPARSRRFDRASALLTLGVARLLEASKLDPAGVGLAAGSAFGQVERSVEFLRRVLERGPRFASPADFPHLVPSAPSGNASIYARLSGPVVSVSDVSTSAEAALGVGATFVDLGLCQSAIVGSAEAADRIVQRVLGPLHGGREPAASEGAALLLIETPEAAASRGIQPLAEVVAVAAKLAEVPLPRSTRARVIASERAVELLAGSEWARVARSELQAEVGSHEARGGFALAAGAALIARESVDEVLVCGVERGRSHFILMAAVPAA